MRGGVGWALMMGAWATPGPGVRPPRAARPAPADHPLGHGLAAHTRAVLREPLAIPLREARSPLVLALDIGTSGLRVFLFDVRGRPVASCIAHADRPLRTSPGGGVTVDAGGRVRAACGGIDGVLARSGRRSSDIAAVAASTFWHSLLGVDASGHPTTRVLTWADTRARGAA